MATSHFENAVLEAENTLLEFLETFETIQNNMRVERLPEFQAELLALAPEGFGYLLEKLSREDPSQDLLQFRDSLVAGTRHCGNALASFLMADERTYSLMAVDMRRSHYRGMQLLYGARAHTPTLASYWLLPEAEAEKELLESPAPDADAPVGIIHQRREAPLADYSLYVPESYTPSREWPMVVCLHGAGGRGDQFIWSWLRPAKSLGYMVLAPKSLDVTWSILRPGLDAGSVTGILEEVSSEYNVNRGRVYLTGLSDGGTFTYLLGLNRSQHFAGIAPVAADFSGMMDDLLRGRQGLDTPIHIVHGAQDHIFPVAQVRSGHSLLERLGYTATYDELPDWGHSYCSFVNERLVMPWFEGLSEQ